MSDVHVCGADLRTTASLGQSRGGVSGSLSGRQHAQVPRGRTQGTILSRRSAEPRLQARDSDGTCGDVAL